MTEIENFIAACDDLIDCKFLVAEHKIEVLLARLAQCEPVYSLVGECMEQFNREREMGKAFVQSANGSYVCIMPTEEYKIIALVFCTLADINAGKIEFNDFVKRFFADENMSPFKRFTTVMVLPFRNLIAEAFGLERIGQSQVASKKQLDEINDGDELPDDNGNEFDELMTSCARIVNQMLDELALMKVGHERDDLELICNGILMAVAEHDLDYIRPLVIGLRHAAKGVRSIKFLVREINDLVESYASK